MRNADGAADCCELTADSWRLKAPTVGAILGRRATRMTIARQELGKSGEDLAVEALMRRGYAIVARRYRTACGEIDIVAQDGETVVFVEVKRRSNPEHGSAAESVTKAKQRQVIRMAVDYLARAGLYDRCPVRFDVVAIDDQPAGPPRILLISDAFTA